MYAAKFQRLFSRLITLFATIFLFSFFIHAQNNALDFDGTDDIVTISNNAAFEFSMGTVEMWIRPATSGNKSVISMRDGTATTRWALYVDQTSGTFGIWNGSTSGTTSSTTITADTWYHVAYVMTTTTTDVYLNGIKVGSTLTTGINTSQTGKPVTLGWSNDASFTTEYYMGDMDEVRIWNDARTELEIRTNMAKSLTGSESNLVAYYNFDEGSAASNNTGVSAPEIQDQTSNNYDGTLSGFAKTGSASNWVDGSGNDVGDTFITTWQTTSASETILLPTGSGSYNYTINWGDGTVESLTAGSPSHVYTTAGTYAITVAGTFPHLQINNNTTYRDKILTIEQWGTVAWSSMNSAFRGTINLTYAATDNPDLSSVTDMSFMFSDCPLFNGDVSNWDVSNVQNMSSTFSNADAFNQDISGWDVSSVTSMNHMLSNSTLFNQDLSAWDVSSVTNMASIFFLSPAFDNGGVALTWTAGTGTSNVTNMQAMFQGTSFNQNISTWNVGNVTSMSQMFQSNSAFNQNITGWNVSKAQNMAQMFNDATAFDQDISGWDVSEATAMNNMFDGATSFNRDLSSWDVSKVTTMRNMFNGATAFNNGGNALTWTTGTGTAEVTEMYGMFLNATSFNQDISTWDIGKVSLFQFMFQGATSFDQSLAAWNISSATNMSTMLNNTNLSQTNYDNTLIGWATLGAGESQIPSNITLGVSGLTYCSSIVERTILDNTYSWTFSGDALDSSGPEINVQGNSMDIADGSTTISSTIDTDFGLSSNAINYTIQNTGSATLNISSITSTGTNSSEFVVSGAPSTVAASGSETFTVTFTSGDSGKRTATITINSDDCDESAYDFAIQGSGPVPGGISTDLQLWLKAGEDWTVSQWDDQSGNSNHATQGSGVAQPASTANAINFNTAVDFDGSDFLTLTNNAGTMGLNNSDYELFFVANSSSTAVQFLMSAVTQERYEMHINGVSGHRFIPADATNFSDIGSDSEYDDGISRIFGGTLQSSGASAASHINGLFTTDIETAGLQTTETGAITIGRREANDSFHWTGQMGEIIIYGDAMTSTQRQQVLSYLALKYGITQDQTSATDYLAADGGTVWNATTNAAYNDDITGLGRDDSSELDQRQSGSINSGAVIEIANGTHASPTTFSADDSWLIWGHDGGATTFGTDNINNSNATTSNRMTRVWRVQETGTVGSVEIRFSNSLASGTVSLVAHTSDATFPADGNRRAIEMTDDGTHYSASIDLADGEYFSFANANYATLTSQFVVINEVITDPQQDWGASNFFNPSPGGTGDADDEWIELYITTDDLDLSSWTIEMNDGTDETGSLSAGGAFNQSNYRSLTGGSLTKTKSGDYLILGDPASGMMNSTGGLTVILKDGSGGTIDQVTIATGSGTGFSGSATGTNDESVARIPNGSDTDVDATDFVKTLTSLGGTSSPSGTVVINEVVTDPFTDWSTSSFDGTLGAGTVSDVDEWIELYIGTSGLNLTGWTMEITDSSPESGSIASGGLFATVSYITSGSGTFINTEAGDYLILGNPSGATNNTGLTIILRDAENNIIDQVSIGGGSGEAPSGSNSAFNSEAIVRYPNATDTGTDDADFIQTRPTLGATNSPTGTVLINEVVTDPQQDWSTNDFDGTIAGGPISEVDEWIELYIGTAGVNLTNWTVELTDGSNITGNLTSTGAFDVSNYITSGSGNFFNTEVGDYLVLGNPDGSGSLEDDIVITLKDASGTTVDEIELGDDVASDGAGDGAPDGSANGGLATSIADEAIARIPNGTDTGNDVNDFSAVPASLGTVNREAQLPEIGNGLDFDGTNDLVNLGSQILSSSTFTVEAWVNGTSFANSGRFNRIMAINYGSYTSDNPFVLFVDNSGNIGYVFGTGAASTDQQVPLSFSPTLSTSTWYHIVLTFDGAEKRLYVDGVLYGTITDAGTFTNTNSEPLLIGDFDTGTSDNGEWEGSIDEVRIWSDVRTHEEIVENMTGLLDPTSANLQAYYRFDQSSGTSLPDLTTNNNDGTLTNMDDSDWTAAGWDIFAQNQAIFQSGGSDVSSGTSGELTLTDVSFLNDNNDLLLAGHDNGNFSEVTSDLPSGTLLTARYDRIWNFVKNDASGTSNGSVRLGFDIRTTPNVTYTYYLLERTSTSGDFAIVPVQGVNPNGNSIEFTVDASAIDNGSYYTLGRSDAGVGNALNFDGTNDQVAIPHDAAFNLNSGDYTFEAWVYPTDGTNQTIISKGLGTGVADSDVFLFSIISNNMFFQLGKSGAGSETHTSNTAITQNTWSHVAAVYNSSSMTVTFYLNGVSDGSGTFSGTLYNADTNPSYIGRQGTSCNCNFFTGDIDELRVWNDQRTQQEILDNMVANLTGDETNLLAYYRFNQGIGDSNTALPDLTANGNGGALTNLGNLGGATTSSNYVTSTRTSIATSVIISNGGNLTATDGELTLTSTQTAGDFLQDANDFIRWNNDGGAFTETTADVPTTTQVTNRYTKTWQLDKNDAVGTANGNVTFTFDLGAVPDPDYTYFLLSRSGTSGDFSIVEALGSSPSGNNISFVVDAGEVTDDYYFTLGRTDTGAGNSLDFDGSNDYATLGDVDAIDGSTTFTFEAWIKPSTASTGERIFSKEVGSGSDGISMAVFGASADQLQLSARNGSNSFGFTGSVLTIGSWNHVAYVYNGAGSGNSDKLKCYVNGIEQSMTFSTTVPSSFSSNAQSFTLGIRSSALDLPFDGEMDEVRIWSDVRTEEEIRDNMNRKLDVANESNLVGYYQFNTGIASGTNTGVDVLTDRSGNGNSGTLTNFALSSTASNWVASTATVADQTLVNSLQGAGNALDFDGVDEYVSIPDNDVFSFGNGTTDSPFSVEFWMSTDLNFGTFVSKRVGTDAEWDIYMGGNQVVVLLRDASTSGTISASTFGLSIGQWHHVAVVYDGSGNHTGIQIYTDGILNVFNTFASGSYTAMENGTSQVEIGISNNTQSPLNGQMDEVRIWNTARTGAEIQANMFESLTGSETGLVAYYTFNESSGTTLDDNSTNTNTGTLTNMEDADWVDATGREPFKTNGPGNLNTAGTWVGGSAPGASQTLYVQHDLTVDGNLTVDDLNLTSGNTLTLNASQTLTVTGNLVNNGTITGDGKIEFTSGTPMISGGTFSNLEMNGGSPMLCGNMTMTGTLTLTSGNLQLENYNLTLNSGASISGGSSTSYIQTFNLNSSGGAIEMQIGSSDGAVTYPLGTNTNYTPISFTNLGTTASFAIRTFDGIYAYSNSGAAFTSNVINKTWDVSATGSGFNVTLNVQWNTADEASGFDRSSMYISTNDGTGWVERAGPLSATEVSSGIYQASASGITSFSGVGGGGDVITPVTLLDFYALQVEGGIELVWHTATEIDNDKFIVERSVDGFEFRAIDEVSGNGNSDDIIEYRYMDINPEVGTNYYRLKQVDFDGDFEYSPIAIAETEIEEHDLVVYPNPFSDRLYIGLKEADVLANIKITGINGQVILAETVISDNRFIQFENLQAPPGIYILEIQQGDEVVRMRIVNE